MQDRISRNMKFILRLKDGITQKEICDKLLMSQSNVSRELKKMISIKLISMTFNIEINKKAYYKTLKGLSYVRK